ncbi:MAG: hypothetical protein Q7Q73_01705, partial [Verrucomicrobiota bacterium JB024]|nr:hypothetical protein [Verrucomicrobiota bacterium JB024]
MTTDESSSIENVWQEIEELVMGLAQISRTEISSQRFYSELVERAIQGLGARGALLWIPDSHRDFELIEQQGLNPETDPILGLSQEQVHRHRMLLNEVLLENEPARIAAYFL